MHGGELNEKELERLKKILVEKKTAAAIDREREMKGKKGFTRRSFVKGSAAAVTASLVVRPGLASPGNSQAGGTEEVPHRPLGKTGALVSRLGGGGYQL